MSSGEGETFQGVRLEEGYAYAILGADSEAAGEEASEGEAATGAQGGLRDAAFFRWPILVSHGIAGGAEGTEMLVHALPHGRMEGVTVVRVVLVEGGPCFASYPKSSSEDGRKTLKAAKTFVEFHVASQDGRRVVTVQSDGEGRSVRSVNNEDDRAARDLAKVLEQARDDLERAKAG